MTQDHRISAFSTLAALLLPDQVVNYVEKFLLAIALAAVTSYVSTKVKLWTERRGKKK